MTLYIWFTVPPALVGLAVVLAVIRAKKDDLPAIVRALMRVEQPDDDSGKGASAVAAQAVRPSRLSGLVSSALKV